MKTEKLKIDNLLKVAAVLEAGTSREQIGTNTEPQKIDFIFGVASCGITPFEKLLYQKSAGDEVTTTVNLQNADEFFGPLTAGILSWQPDRGELFLKVGIHSVSKPQDSEVVKALASGGGCGGDCDCGCGCD
ncbi:MAG: hypothetical protein GY697_08005 [Desulfobacterales bacterium]|nr:hypothetical protein [Desulfobacterales bacterium]